MSFEVTSAIPAQQCPFCGYKMDHASGERPPKKGDVSLCLKCMEISVFSDGLRMRSPTDAEMIELQRSGAWDLIERARAHHRSLGIKNTIDQRDRA